MHLVHTAAEFTRHLDDARAAGHRVGVVPTMGALHEGHLSLVHAVRRAGADFVAMTVFVNPTQFGRADDLAAYPRTLEADCVMANGAGVDLLFAPTEREMYPNGFSTHVEVAGITERWEGAFRPGHFRGVATVVTKLLAMTAPATAAFGQKDYQQLRTLEALVRDLNLRIEVVGVPTMRDPDGLAMSSRNRRLGAAERARALSIPRALRAAHAAFAAGTRDAEELAALIRAGLEPHVDAVDYAAVVHPGTLEPIAGPVSEAVALVAAHVTAHVAAGAGGHGGNHGTVRLIDNCILHAPLTASGFAA